MQAFALTQTRLAAPGWSGATRRRAWAALLVLAIALASVLHLAHKHEADSSSAYQVCSFCTNFDRASAPPPVVETAVAFVPPAPPAAVVDFAKPASTVARSPCHPRAPPALQA